MIHANLANLTSRRRRRSRDRRDRDRRLAQPAEAGGLRNCVDITGKQIDRVGCYENVWADGTEHRMTFSNQHLLRAPRPTSLDPFYVLAPQRADRRRACWPPSRTTTSSATVPAGDTARTDVKLQGYFVLCTGQGLASGALRPRPGRARPATRSRSR